MESRVNAFQAFQCQLGLFVIRMRTVRNAGQCWKLENASRKHRRHTITTENKCGGWAEQDINWEEPIRSTALNFILKAHLCYFWNEHQCFYKCSHLRQKYNPNADRQQESPPRILTKNGPRIPTEFDQNRIGSSKTLFSIQAPGPTEITNV